MSVQEHLANAQAAVASAESVRTSRRPIAPVRPSVYFDADVALAKLREARAEVWDALIATFKHA
jgi:hypothetical protein